MSISHLVFLAITLAHSSLADNYHTRKFSLEFFEEKSIRQMTVFACWDSHGRVNYFIAKIHSELLSGTKTVRFLLEFACFPILQLIGIERVSFYLQSLDFEFKLSYIPIRSDVLDMRRILTVNYYALGILLDLECPSSYSVLEQFSSHQLPYNQTYHWLLVSNLDSPPETMLKDLPLTVDTEMTVALDNGSDYILYDVWNPSYRHGGSLNVTLMGYWNLASGLELLSSQYKYQRRGNLAGLSINVSLAITHEPSPDFETYITTPINRHFDTMHRYHYALIRHLGEYYNFTINLHRTDSWGYLVNGSFNGMLGDMVAGIVDIGGTPLQFLPERVQVAEFTVQTYVARAAFIFRHPKKSTVRNGFLKPFTEEVWWLTMIMAVTNWIVLWLTLRMEIHYKSDPLNSTLQTNTASETALITAAALCQQGLSVGPTLYSGRLVFLSLFLWALLLFQYYSASIVGSLLAEPPRYIRTIRDLADSDLSVGIEDIAYTNNYFATTTDQDSLDLYKRKIGPRKGRPRPAYFTVREGLRKVQKGNFAYHIDVATAYKIITDEFSEDEICDLAEIAIFPKVHVATVTSKHSPFKKMVTYGMRQIIESGIAERLKHVWQYERPRCPSSHSLKPVSVPIEEFAPALFLLLIGSIGAAGMLFAEYCATWRNSHSCVMEKH